MERVPRRLNEACAFLQEVLADGPRLTTEVEQLAWEASISDHTLRRARQTLGVQARHSAFRGAWLLALPETANPTQSPPTREDGGLW
jgi:hypothetical protein